jgi:hypothetical protein
MVCQAWARGPEWSREDRRIIIEREATSVHKDNSMKIARFRSGASAFSLVLVLASAAAFAQGDPLIGTWVLNGAKSTFPPGAQPQSMTLVVSDAGGGKLKSVSNITINGTTIQGEVTFAVDGQEYVPTSTPPPPAGVVFVLDRQ